MASKENEAGVKVIEAMFKTHKIIPPGAISLGQLGQQQGLPVQAGRLRDEPVQHLRVSRRQRQGPPEGDRPHAGPGRPQGHREPIDTWAYGAFKKTPYPELAKGLLDYFMTPANYDRIIQSTGGRWVPVYKRLFDSPFWRERPAFQHFIKMAETGVPVSYAGSPTPAAGEVLNTHVIPKMIQRVLVDNWRPPRPSTSATSASWRSTRATPGLVHARALLVSAASEA